MREEILITNIQRYSIHDGEGIRTTVFVKGCPLKCSWCANPETQSYKNEIMHMRMKCKKCMACVHACKNNALKIGKDGYPFRDKELCIQCGKCVDACIYGSMKYAAGYYSIEEIAGECVKDKVFYGDKGGVTLSGGECLSFEEKILSLIELLEKENIRITFETCGYGDSKTLLEYSEHAQRIYFDIKHYDTVKFKDETGGNLTVVINNFKELTQKYSHTAVRIPVIYDVNDSEQDMEKLALLIKNNVGKMGVEFIELLPFHNMGESKYEALYREYKFKERANMNKDHVKEYCHIFEKQGFRCIVN